MEPDGIHELTAAYALDALDPEDARLYEEHLAGCERCRQELALLREAAAALGLAAGGPAPPATLRDRIRTAAPLAEARRRPRRARGTTVALVTATFAACASVALGGWSLTLTHRLHATRSQLANVQQVAFLMARSDTRHVSLSGRPGQLLVGQDGQAALVVALDRAPSGRVYQVWVLATLNSRARPAGVLRGGDRPAVVLSQPVWSGTVVMITLERGGGVPAPTGSPLATAQVA
ncbi:MAG: anti-sigma factor [Gaiellaceae bacterium]